MVESIKFSITIPSFRIKFLKEAIASCLRQTYRNMEVIVVDDASPEDIYSVVSSFSDSRLRYYRNEKNCGAVDVVDNWNICLGYCTGDYVICMGDDDMLSPDCLEEYAMLIGKYPDLAVYHALTDVVDEDGNVIDHQRQRPEYQTCMELIKHRWMGDMQFIGDFCYDVNMLRKAGGYYKLPLAWGSDDITAVRASAIKGVANTQKSTFLYRSNSYTITQSKTNKIKLLAKSKEWEWYVWFLKRNRERILLTGTETEKLILGELINGGMDTYFNRLIELHLLQFFEESIWNISDAMKMSFSLRRSKGNILYLWHKVLKKKIGIKL